VAMWVGLNCPVFLQQILATGFAILLIWFLAAVVRRTSVGDLSYVLSAVGLIVASALCAYAYSVPWDAEKRKAAAAQVTRVSPAPLSSEQPADSKGAVVPRLSTGGSAISAIVRGVQHFRTGAETRLRSISLALSPNPSPQHSPREQQPPSPLNVPSRTARPLRSPTKRGVRAVKVSAAEEGKDGNVDNGNRENKTDDMNLAVNVVGPSTQGARAAQQHALYDLSSSSDEDSETGTAQAVRPSTLVAPSAAAVAQAGSSRAAATATQRSRPRPGAQPQS
jgi:hypothetical protein